jgi:ADP-ribosylglycohydrolase
MKHCDPVRACLFGVAVGDALGVPVEFTGRYERQLEPVTDMMGYGNHHQPPGTWSDDCSMAFCLAEVLTTGFDLEAIGSNFRKWLYENYWTPYGEVFDSGNATRAALQRLKKGVPPEEAGGQGERDNGNGALMRILPLVFYTKDMPIGERFDITRRVSSITHAHIRSVISCFYYLEFALAILEEKEKFSIYEALQQSVPAFLGSAGIDPAEIRKFDRLLNGKIYELPENQVRSTGYVVDTLEAATWCLLTTTSYKEAVLKAVNLGEDQQILYIVQSHESSNRPILRMGTSLRHGLLLC